MQEFTQKQTHSKKDNPKPRQPRRSPDQWQALVNQWQDSGLSMQSFCKKNNLAYQSFCNWKAKLATASQVDQAEAAPAFIDLSNVTQPAQSNWQITLKLADGIELQLSQQTC